MASTAGTFDTRKAYEIPEKRELIVKIAKWYTCIFNKNATITDAAKKFGISSTTVSKYFNKDLPMIDLKLADKVDKKSKKLSAKNRFKKTKK